MPGVITPYAVLVWFSVGLFTGVGWTLGAWLIGRVVR